MNRSDNNHPGARGRGGGRGGYVSGRGRGGGRGEDGGDGRGNGGYSRGGRGRGYNYPQQHYQSQQGQYGSGRGTAGQQHNWAQRSDQPAVPVRSDVGGRSWSTIAAPRPADSQILDQTQRRLADIQIQEVPKVKQQCVAGENAYTPIRRPDKGGTLAVRSIKLFVNHFNVGFNPSSTILHYDVEVKRDDPSPNPSLIKRSILKSDLRLIREQLFTKDSKEFPLLKTAYDGEKNIFSAVPLPCGSYKVQLSDEDGARIRSYEFTIKFVKELRLSKLRDYLSGNVLQIPREVLQGMDLVMKERLFQEKVSLGKEGRGFYPRMYREEDDLHCGVAAFKGFQQSLKPTCNGLQVCVDYSALAFRKRMAVLDFLQENIEGLRRVDDMVRFKGKVLAALRGLRVTVTHRRTKQKYTIHGLTNEVTSRISFKLEDPEGNEAARDVMLVDYFQEKWGKKIVHKGIPCLELGNKRKPNYVPMEFCVLADDRRYPTEDLNKEAERRLKEMSIIPPNLRLKEIGTIMQEEYGHLDPRNDVIPNFELGVDMNMTQVIGRVMPPPNSKIGASRGGTQTTTVDKDKCQWNLTGGKTFVVGTSAERWAFIDFTGGRLNSNAVIGKLIQRCRSLGVRMEEPLEVYYTDMNKFSSVRSLEEVLSSVAEAASKYSKGKLQLVVCAMACKDKGYKSLKWVSETRMGIITQCCLSTAANKLNDQYFANLGMKINAKLGGSNMELNERLPCFVGGDRFMFIGADVNHPAAMNKTSPSIAAVVGSVNWPAATRYAARVSFQKHRQEEIDKFGEMCLDLVKTYTRMNNGARPNKIVVFRDGVSEGQFDMVLNNELVDLKRAFSNENYFPTVTLVVARKRHMTRLFLTNMNDGVRPGNVPPGTVVDTKIVHPFEFDFYLASHFGGLGTSKPTHYSVLWDENGFKSDTMQKLVYDLCFTFARCTKPVSLVPPVYYADLVAYRGRMFQEVEMELQSSASSSSSRGSDNTYLQQMFYNLEPDLKNCMFFV